MRRNNSHTFFSTKPEMPAAGRVEVFYCAFVKANKEAEQSGESGLCADTSSAPALNSDIGDGDSD